VLKEKKNPRIGLVERAFIPMTFYEYLVKHLPGAAFEDATDWIDELRVVKSPEEIELIKCAAAIQDACLEELKNIIRPGKRDLDVYAEIHCFLSKRGSERGLVRVGSGPMGTLVPVESPHFQNRVIQDGDQVSILIETNGPGGYYTEVLRVLTVGKKPTQLLQDTFGNAVEALEMTARKLLPGADPKELWSDYKNFMAQKGYGPPLWRSRSFAHGQGLSLVERPNLRPDEPFKIRAGMNITIHPYAACKGAWTWCGDNYITTDNGPVRVHRCPREIAVL
jgi:Xaa-Pro aminopeptidase